MAKLLRGILLESILLVSLGIFVVQTTSGNSLSVFWIEETIGYAICAPDF